VIFGCSPKNRQVQRWSYWYVMLSSFLQGVTTTVLGTCDAFRCIPRLIWPGPFFNSPFPSPAFDPYAHFPTKAVSSTPPPPRCLRCTFTNSSHYHRDPFPSPLTPKLQKTSCTDSNTSVMLSQRRPHPSHLCAQDGPFHQRRASSLHR
jgi:hypothetical protein